MGAENDHLAQDRLKGVRYREHPARKHGILPDRYYVLSCRRDGRTKTEAVGWDSDGNKPSETFKALCELKRNQKPGLGPLTLAEVHQEAEAAKAAEAERQAAEKQQTFQAFFDEIFLPDAKGRWKPQMTEKAVQHVANWISPVTGDTPFRDIGLYHIKWIKASLADAGRSPRQQQYVFRTFSMVGNAALDAGLPQSRYI